MKRATDVAGAHRSSGHRVGTLAQVEWETVYAAGPRGYSDYPTLRQAAA
jgi:hypothetical protein